MDHLRPALTATILTVSVALSVGCTVSTSTTGAATVQAPATGAATVQAPAAQAQLTALPPVTTDNRNALIAVAPVTVTASSTYGGWPASNATDGKLQTSWYSARDDSAARGKAPFLQLALATPSTVHRVTVLGNRDPNYLNGYTILSGKLELLDASGRPLLSLTSTGTGNRRDFDFRAPNPVSGVSTIRFTSLQDEGNQNAYGDVAIAEIQVE